MWFLLLLVSILTCSLSSNVCPGNCVCEHAGLVQCFRVLGFPTGIPKGVRKLNLGYSHIKELKSKDFSGLTDLEEIIVSSCGVETMETSAFKQQGLLRTLELSKNKLKSVPHSLPIMLNTLKVASNKIQALPESSFEGLQELRVLDLQNNLITNLRASTFSSLAKLEFLYLDNNNIETVHGSLRLPHLRLLSLARNKILSLSSAFFSPLRFLKTLYLHENLLARVPYNLPQCLSSLNLDHNLIRTLRTRELGHLHSLLELSVSHNKLVSVDSSLRLPNLTMLEVCGNHLRSLPYRLSPGLVRLDCRENSIQEITKQQLSGLRHLRHLFLENNTIQHFDANALKNCVHLTNLALEQNLLSDIPLGLPESLVRLDLKGNRIETIHEQALQSLKHLQVLNLRNNKLSFLSLSALDLLPRLKKVYLDGNPWNCSCELLRAKRRLLERKVEILTELCNDPILVHGDDWREHLKAQDRCEDYILQASPEKQGKTHVQTDHTDNEEYYDYDFQT